MSRIENLRHCCTITFVNTMHLGLTKFRKDTIMLGEVSQSQKTNIVLFPSLVVMHRIQNKCNIYEQNWHFYIWFLFIGVTILLRNSGFFFFLTTWILLSEKLGFCYKVNWKYVIVKIKRKKKDGNGNARGVWCWAGEYHQDVKLSAPGWLALAVAALWAVTQ